jgi:outer membrane protein assembly factor BamD (BamD/ComL family)
MAPNFEELENGSDYLKRFPDSPYAPAVTVRQDLLAEELYKEVILYQQVGDHGKAVEGINQILTWAPLSAAAAKLSDEAVLSG